MSALNSFKSAKGHQRQPKINPKDEKKKKKTKENWKSKKIHNLQFDIMKYIIRMERDIFELEQ